MAEVCRKLGMSEATFYNGTKKFSVLGPDELSRLRQLEEDNGRLKQIVVRNEIAKTSLVGKPVRKPNFIRPGVEDET